MVLPNTDTRKHGQADDAGWWRVSFNWSRSGLQRHGRTAMCWTMCFGCMDRCKQRHTCDCDVRRVSRQSALHDRSIRQRSVNWAYTLRWLVYVNKFIADGCLSAIHGQLLGLSAASQTHRCMFLSTPSRSLHAVFTHWKRNTLFHSRTIDRSPHKFTYPRSPCSKHPGRGGASSGYRPVIIEVNNISMQASCAAARCYQRQHMDSAAQNLCYWVLAFSSETSFRHSPQWLHGWRNYSWCWLHGCGEAAFVQTLLSYIHVHCTCICTASTCTQLLANVELS